MEYPDGDRRIKRSDFENSVNKKLVEARNPDAVKRLREWVIKMCDATGLVGDVSYSYESYRTHLQSQLNNPEVKQAFHEIFVAHFDYLDAEGRGYITLKEYRILWQPWDVLMKMRLLQGLKIMTVVEMVKLIEKNGLKAFLLLSTTMMNLWLGLAVLCSQKSVSLWLNAVLCEHSIAELVKISSTQV